MGSFGESMQREREMRTISLEEIAESTKISKRMLRALEEEDFAKLPGGIFNKGFVRAYAKYLGLDEEQAVSDFMAAFTVFQAGVERAPFGEAAAGNFTGGVGLSETISSMEAGAAEPAQSAQGAGLIAAAVIFVIVLGAGGFFFKYYQGKKASPASVAGVSASPTRRSHAGEKKPEPGPVQASMVAVPSVNNPVPAADKSSSAITSVLAASAQPNEAAPPENSYPEFYKETSATSGDAAAKNSKKKLSLEIRSKQESWVRITADGHILMEGMLLPSASRQFQAAKELVVKLGNASVIELSYNGKPVPSFPPDTKTKTLTITAQGLTSE